MGSIKMYNLKINEEQAEVIVRALDLFSRIGICQFKEILNHPTWRRRLLTDLEPKDRREIEYHIELAGTMLSGYPANSGPGITVADEPNRIAYDILQVIEHELIKSRRGIDKGSPMKWSNQELPILTEEK